MKTAARIVVITDPRTSATLTIDFSLRDDAGNIEMVQTLGGKQTPCFVPAATALRTIEGAKAAGLPVTDSAAQ